MGQDSKNEKISGSVIPHTHRLLHTMGWGGLAPFSLRGRIPRGPAARLLRRPSLRPLTRHIIQRPSVPTRPLTLTQRHEPEAPPVRVSGPPRRPPALTHSSPTPTLNSPHFAKQMSCWGAQRPLSSHAQQAQTPPSRPSRSTKKPAPQPTSFRRTTSRSPPSSQRVVAKSATYKLNALLLKP